MINNSRPKNGSGVSSATSGKLDLYGGLVRIVATIARPHLRRKPFLIIEMNAGPGFYTEDEYSGAGSPLIAGRVLQELAIPHLIICMNSLAAHDQSLRCAVMQDDMVRFGAYKHYFGDNAQTLANLRLSMGNRGIAFYDPFALPDLRMLTDWCKRPETAKIDLLINLSATTVKRVAGHDESPRRITQEIEHLNKRYWMIRGAPSDDNQQWLMMYGSNHKLRSPWTRMQFVPLDSPEGIAYRNRFDYTLEERNLGYSHQQPLLPQLQGVSSPSAI